jgi:hypothetical protein
METLPMGGSAFPTAVTYPRSLLVIPLSNIVHLEKVRGRKLSRKNGSLDFTEWVCQHWGQYCRKIDLRGEREI